MSILMILIMLTACGGSGGGEPATDEPTDTSLSFSLYPATYFDGSYFESYSQKSVDSNVSWTVRLGSTIAFNGQPISTIEDALSFTDNSSGVVLSGVLERYFSTDTNNLTLVGYYLDFSGVVAMATSVDILPLTATIGSFGSVGSYSLSDGESEVITWALLDGYNGKARLEITKVTRDSAGALSFTETDTWMINQDGTRLSVTTTVMYHQSGNKTLIWSPL
ncbi:MAG: hypothetical protein COB30_006280 [Ectothiorhodospiraceae bacterium]|nr:hypothetical protein [Ectothiorhodospiraceae bacterium]